MINRLENGSLSVKGYLWTAGSWLVLTVPVQGFPSSGVLSGTTRGVRKDWWNINTGVFITSQWGPSLWLCGVFPWGDPHGQIPPSAAEMVGFLFPLTGLLFPPPEPAAVCERECGPRTAGPKMSPLPRQLLAQRASQNEWKLLKRQAQLRVPQTTSCSRHPLVWIGTPWWWSVSRRVTTDGQTHPDGAKWRLSTWGKGSWANQSTRENTWSIVCTSVSDWRLGTYWHSQGQLC